MGILKDSVYKIMGLWTKIQSILLTIPIIGSLLDFMTLSLSSFVLRFGSGHWVASNIDECERPIKPLKLYEYEICPYCRKVRETLNVLDLDCIIYPCPRETLSKHGDFTKNSRFRPIASQLSTKDNLTFPLLVDENKDSETPLILNDSKEIIEYLWKQYGSRAKAPPSYKIAQITGITTLFLAMFVRNMPQHGLLRVPSRKPEKLLELWEFEPSPFAKRVREALSCLELAYLKKTAARGSKNRKEFKAKYGHLLSQARKSVGIIQVPLLVDPNNDVVMLESNDIVKYLYDTYAIGKIKFESWDKFGSKKSE